MSNINTLKIILITKKSTFMKKWVPLTTIKVVQGALKRGESVKITTPETVRQFLYYRF